MNKEDFEKMEIGAIVRHKLRADGQVIISREVHEGRLVYHAVRLSTVSNPDEWELIYHSGVTEGR